MDQTRPLRPRGEYLRPQGKASEMPTSKRKAGVGGSVDSGIEDEQEKSQK